jgi:hypothetical protein
MSVKETSSSAIHACMISDHHCYVNEIFTLLGRFAADNGSYRNFCLTIPSHLQPSAISLLTFEDRAKSFFLNVSKELPISAM